MKYHLIVYSRDCLDTLPRSVLSGLRQREDLNVCIVDTSSDSDCSTFVKAFSEKQGFEYLLLDSMVDSMTAKARALEYIFVERDDVVVYLSGLNTLPDGCFDALDDAYSDDDCTVTYGGVLSHRGDVWFSGSDMFRVLSTQPVKVFIDLQ